MKEVMFSSKSEEWETPQKLFNELDGEFNFILDPCATKDNHKCPMYFTKKENGLKQDWGEYLSVFMNPPYGKNIGLWVKKAYETALGGFRVVCLLPARTDTKWFHAYCLPDSHDGVKKTVRFIKGRLKFGDSKNSAPFPSMIVIMESSLGLIPSEKHIKEAKRQAQEYRRNYEKRDD